MHRYRCEIHQWQSGVLVACVETISSPQWPERSQDPIVLTYREIVMKTLKPQIVDLPRVLALMTGICLATLLCPMALAAGESRDELSDPSHASALSAEGDDVVRAAVDAHLSGNPNTDIIDLEVEVQDGIVTLQGRVATPAEKQLAARYAQDVQGARGVVNAIDVVPGLTGIAPGRAD
jgi:hypothetical protein